MAEVDIKYKGTSIATMNASGTKTLGTSGKFCEADISVEYTKPTPSGTIQIDENGTYDVTQYASAEVSVSGGVVSADEKDVNFYDYDGTCVAAYTAAEFANLSALPDNPSHDGLTAQGWNWTLADAKAHVQNHGWLHVGQLYTTDDGKTRIYIRIPLEADADFRLFTIRYRQTVSNGVVVDWGDGETNTYSGTTAANHDHTYASGGNYCITLEAVNGDLHLDTNSGNTIAGSANSGTRYKSAYITRIEIGNAKSIGASCFAQCRCAESILISRNISFNDTSGVFGGCSALRFVSLPQTVTSIGAGMFSYCGGLLGAAIPKEALTMGATAYLSCGSLRRVLIPESTTEIGNQAFNNCSGLQIVVLPATVSSIGAQVFTNNFSTVEYHIKATTPPALANTNAFTGITAKCKIYVPNDSLSAYKAAANWSTYASKMIGE